MNWNEVTTHGGQYFPIIVWPDGDRGRREYGTQQHGSDTVDKRPWIKHCDPPPLRAMKTVSVRDPFSGLNVDMQIPDPANPKRADCVPVDRAEASEMQTLADAGMCQLYATVAEAAAAHRDLDFDQLPRIMGVDV